MPLVTNSTTVVTAKIDTAARAAVVGASATSTAPITAASGPIMVWIHPRRRGLAAAETAAAAVPGFGDAVIGSPGVIRVGAEPVPSGKVPRTVSSTYDSVGCAPVGSNAQGTEYRRCQDPLLQDHVRSGLARTTAGPCHCERRAALPCELRHCCTSCTNVDSPGRWNQPRCPSTSG